MTHLRFLFASAVFLASFLLFLVEPIAARQLLPSLGGSATVWITCLVFFQTALLLGYLYAHWLARRSSFMVHLSLLLLAVAAAILWVLRPPLMEDGAAHPILTVFSALSLSIGLPFLVLSSTSPLLQVWWARAETGKIPYRLYALSNVGSLLAPRPCLLGLSLCRPGPLQRVHRSQPRHSSSRSGKVPARFRTIAGGSVPCAFGI